MTTGRNLRWGEAVFGGGVASLGLLIAFQTVTHAGSVNAVVGPALFPFLIATGLVIIGAALLAALLVKTFLFQPFYIPSESMEPSLRVNDRLLVNKLNTDPDRGEIVVFKRPPGEAEGPTNKDLIKRVIAVGGDTVEGKVDGVYVNGKKVDEPYVKGGITGGPFEPVKVERGHVWVMGDNRGNSADSRVFGPIDIDTIVGRATMRIWPPWRAAFL